MHPSKNYTGKEIYEAMQAHVANGLVSEKSDGDLRLYCYTQRAVYERAWDTFVEMARGLVIDISSMKVIATPFPKFFNYGERTISLPDEPFEVFEKLDGSLGVVYHDGVRWRVNTKGAFASEQAKRAERILETKNLDCLSPGDTYLFEIVYPENRIVVKYAFEDLVLLAAYAADGREYTRLECANTASVLGSQIAKVYDLDTIEKALETVNGFSSDKEGFVVRFRSGLRIKIKGEQYLSVHRLLSNVTPLGIWGIMETGTDPSLVRREIPEEFHGDFDNIERILSSKLSDLLRVVEEEYERTKTWTDKELGLSLASLPAPAKHFVFWRRKDGPDWTKNKRTMTAILKHIRPTGNTLEGYKPSIAMNRIEE